MHNVEPSLEARSFNEELAKLLKKLGEKYGYKIPSFNALEKDGALFINLTAFSGKPDNFYRHWYLANAIDLGLEESWLGVSFENHNKTKTLTLIGLDPDGGENCIRVRDGSKVDFHISPATLSHLIVNQL